MILLRDFHQELIDIIGAGDEACCLFTPGDHRQENAAKTTFLTKGQGALDGLTVTYNPGARTDFDDPTYHIRNQFRLPWMTLNGVDESAQTPDIAAFSRNDGAGQGFSFGGLLIVLGSASQKTVLQKSDLGVNEEWQFGFSSDEKLRLGLKDESANVNAFTTASPTAMLGRPVVVGASYGGAGGSAAADDIDLYGLGSILASTATNNASYVAMEPLAADVFLGENEATDWFPGQMSIVYFTHRVLSAAEHFDINDVLVAAQRADRSRLLAGIF